MAGRVIELLSKTSYVWSNLANSGTTEIFIANDIDISGYKEGTLEVRVHACTVPSGATITFTPYSTAPSREAPDTFFRKALSTVQATNSTSAPTLLTVAVSANAGGWLSVSITAAVTTAGTFTATLSAVLSLKE